jgi:hypothetical protein
MAKMKIVIEVDGGCVNNVWTSKDAEITIIDRDDNDDCERDFDKEIEKATKGMIENALR